jgi:hypothetical protein
MLPATVNRSWLNCRDYGRRRLRGPSWWADCLSRCGYRMKEARPVIPRALNGASVELYDPQEMQRIMRG